MMESDQGRTMAMMAEATNALVPGVEENPTGTGRCSFPE